MVDRLHPLDHESPPPADQRVETLYAWIATHTDGAEGIVAGILPGLGSVPLVTSKRHVADQLGVVALRTVHVAEREGKPITITLATFKRVP